MKQVIIIEELLESLLQGLEESMKGSEFIFESVDVLYYILNEISLNRGGSYIDFPEWLKNKKATINPKNNDDKCFQYAVPVALNHEKLKTIQKGYQKLNLLLTSIIGKKLSFHHIKKIGKSLNYIINELLLMFYMRPTILKK